MGTEDRRTKEQRKKKRERKTEGQKNRKKINGTENGRTEEQKKKKRERMTEGQKDRKQKNKRTKTGGKGEQEKGVNFLRQPWSNLTEPLEQYSSSPVTLLRGCWRKITEGVGNYAETHGTMPFCTPRKIFSAFCLADIKKTDTFATLLESTGV